MKSKANFKKNKGITLLVLTVTIVVLLILAGITISMLTGENGIINKTGDAKEQTEIANEKEIVGRATVNAIGKNKYGDLKQDELEKQLNKEAEGKTEVTDVGEEFEILFKESNRYYTVDKEGNISQPQQIVKDNFPGDLTKGGTLDGSENNPYEINCIEDLVVFSNMCKGSGIKFENGKIINIEKGYGFSGKKIILKRNLNFKSKYSYINSERTDFGNINGDDEDGNTLINEMTTGTGFVPIGLYANNSNIFSGEFDGKEYKIEGLYECDDSKDIPYGGLFGVAAYGAKIENIKISGYIKKMYSNGINCSVGGICGMICYYGDNTTINNCISNVKIEANGYGVGGIVGRIFRDTTVSNCQNYGDISSNVENSTGGIIGRIDDVKCNVYNNCNIGNIKSKAQGKGGIIGGIVGASDDKNEVNIFNVCNFGQIDGNLTIGKGGIAGYIDKRTVNMQNVYNLVKIDGEAKTWMEGVRWCYRIYIFFR